jgi:hypothetical protein
MEEASDLFAINLFTEEEDLEKQDKEEKRSQ